VNTLEDKAFLLLVGAVSLAFAWLVWPFYGAVLWGTVIAILFAPLNRQLFVLLRQRKTLAALVTVIVIVLIVILPVSLITALLVEEASGVYQRMQSGQFDEGRYVQRLLEALPGWIFSFLDHFGLADAGTLQERLRAGLLRASQILATQVINIGQNAFDFTVSLFVMLYLLFFLLRDGDALARRINDALPLHAEEKRALFRKFVIVIRATVKGSVVVAVVQGALGGLIFWILGIHAPILWAVLMTFASLLPALGAGLVWVPVGVYLLVTGAVWRGAVLIAFGILVISVVDNVLRPILVGKDTKMPDYVVLISTLGGLSIFGANGLVMGPVIAAMFFAVWDNFTASRSSAARSHH